MKITALFWIVSVAVAAGTACVASADDPLEFNRDIRPILSENCFYCHGFDQANRKAGLRLDTLEGATDSDALVPGKPDESELLRRIVSDDPDEVMPPPETEKQISPADQDLIRRWIQQGGTYQQHWAWRPLRRPDAPDMGVSKAEVLDADGESQKAAIVDAFLQSAWQDQGVTPVGRGSPRQLLRRLSFDLRGIPPTAAEVRQIEQSPTDETFLAFRDRWMNELAYAEHQAVQWLDLVRWADTSGLVSDEPIASGAYRAWIIEAIDRNMPFDQFSIEQLAGDLLDNPTSDQLVASGYNRIVNTNCEAGAIETEQLYKLKGEHVRALGTVWLGLTTGCAECHDHKFDPILAKDYYSLAAFFDDLVEAGVYTPGDRREPLHYVHASDDDAQQDRQLMAKIAEITENMSSHLAEDADGSGPTKSEFSRSAFDAWETETRAKLKSEQDHGGFVWIGAEIPWARIIEGRFEMETVAGRLARRDVADGGGLRRHHVAELMTGYINQRSQKSDAKRDRWFVDVWLDADDRPEMIGFQISHGDYGRVGWRTANYETYFWGNDSSGALSKTYPWSDPARVKRMGDLPQESGWVRLEVPFDQMIQPVGGQSFEAVGMAWLSFDGSVMWGDSGLEVRQDKATALQLGETAIRKWWETPMNRQVYQSRAEQVAKSVLADSKSRDDVQQELVIDAYRESTGGSSMDRLRKLESELGRVRAAAMPVLVSRQSETRKETRLLNRGDYQDTAGPLVSPAIPEFLGTIATDKGRPTRLDLANWLFDAQNPLTARVYVNRLWKTFFGRGISETLEDAGTQGSWPSHVALLDWLATEFRDSGWDRKHMVRLLTSTDAYRLDSQPSDDLRQRDPSNRWHARQSRFRLPAETIRDSALDAAGLLKVSGDVPILSFFPYQPSAYWTRSDKVMFGSRHLAWNTSEDRNQYHRSMYTFWKRQNIHPTMLAFDAPTRQECTAMRNITNTPGQALALLNDPTFVEAARVFATRVLETRVLETRVLETRELETRTTETRELDSAPQDSNATSGADASADVPGSVDAGADDEAKIDGDRFEFAFQTALQRSPTSDEHQVLAELLRRQRAHYASNPDDAQALVAIGQTPLADGADVTEIAAWTVVTRTILNLHEFLNRS
ncbi:Planctomycete cytochrome C [Rubripirellula lacrimiformis]|uniref:Planctomycete cytochrome C n=1 Tax=Rubripirellula lacrimiformis TaxID=1930273 RepID=A0A517NEJ5_9BACT|nr:PSD1 and planctomycete cytochrome C domain-containing protein [Rubripirellula lacrimiformis]QDT05478.1 Planctomycete cytochrome C [Rubripirellula lacrimiformis]